MIVSKFSKEEMMERIDETEKVLLEDLDLKENLSFEELNDFYVKFIPYLMHNRDKKVLGRTPEKLKENIDKYIIFCEKVGLTKKEIIQSIGNFPSIIHTFDDEFVDKYALMGIVENEDNSLRKDKLIRNPRSFSIDINTIYSRMRLMQELNYPINWSNLVKATNEEFASIFVIGKYYKSYKIFSSIDEVNTVLNNYFIDYNIINDIRNLDINSNLFKGNVYGK